MFIRKRLCDEGYIEIAFIQIVWYYTFSLGKNLLNSLKELFVPQKMWILLSGNYFDAKEIFVWQGDVLSVVKDHNPATI